MTIQAKKGSKPLQLSETAIREKLRQYAPEAIDILVNIMRNGDNDNAKMGAAKVVLAKVVPDLKSSEIKGEIAGKWIVELKKYGTNPSNQIVN